jgi:hypothetical protein
MCWLFLRFDPASVRLPATTVKGQNCRKAMNNPIFCLVYRAIILLVTCTGKIGLRRVEAIVSPPCVYAVDVQVSTTTKPAIHLHKTPRAYR